MVVTNQSTLKVVELHIGKCQMRAPYSSTQLPCVADVQSAIERKANHICAEKTAHGHIQVINY